MPVAQHVGSGELPMSVTAGVRWPWRIDVGVWMSRAVWKTRLSNVQFGPTCAMTMYSGQRIEVAGVRRHRLG